MIANLTNAINSSDLVKKSAFNYKARIDFYYQIAKLTGEAELTFLQAIREIQNMQVQKSTANKKAVKTPLYYVYLDVISKLVTGIPISVALSNYIPETDKIMIASFEGSDNFSVGFEDLVSYNESIKNMNDTVRNAIMYPSFMVAFLLGVLSYFCLTIVPQLTITMTPNTPLSPVSAAMLWLTNNYFLWFGTTITTLVLVVLFLIWSLPNMNNKYRIFLEDYPPYSLYRVKLGCTFMAALNGLTKSELTQAEAIEKMYKMSKPYLKHRLLIIHNQLKYGKPLGTALQDAKLNFPDKNIVSYLAVLSKHGVLEESLDKITATIMERGLELVQKQAKTVKVIITALIGAGILFSFSSIYLISQDMSAGLEQQAK